MTEDEKRAGSRASGAAYLRWMISMIEAGEVVSFTVVGLRDDGRPVHRTMLADPDHDDWTALCRLRTEAELIDTAVLLNRAKLFTFASDTTGIPEAAATDRNPVEDPDAHSRGK
jgi:hypothetical protein